MKQEIDNNAMWAAFRQELALQGELHVVAAIDNALNNLGFTIEETSSVIPIPLKQGEQKPYASETMNEKGDFDSGFTRMMGREQKPADKVEQKGMNTVEEDMTPFQKKVFCIIDITIEEEQGLKQVCDELLRLAYDEIMQKPAWSEEDENGLGDALWAIKQAKTIAKDENDMGNLWYAERWLKSIKNRCAYQPKKGMERER